MPSFPRPINALLKDLNLQRVAGDRKKLQYMALEWPASH